MFFFCFRPQRPLIQTHAPTAPRRCGVPFSHSLTRMSAHFPKDDVGAGSASHLLGVTYSHSFPACSSAVACVHSTTACLSGGKCRRAGDDGMGCGPLRNIPCDHIFDVSSPTLTPFVVSNGTGAAIVIAPGGGYRDLAWGKVRLVLRQPKSHTNMYTPAPFVQLINRCF